MECSYFEDWEDKKIGQNEILFINWDSINKKDINIWVRENEQDNNLNSIVRNTKEENREIILVIDESHHTAGSEKSKELIEVISPKITLEVSATPHLKEDLSEIVRVKLNEVKEEEMIKEEISVNPEFMNMKVGSKSSDELVIEQALKKREQLTEMYKKVGSAVNPLLLIQLPDKRQGMEDKKEYVTKVLMNQYNITEENSKLAIWLSEEKSDALQNIDKNDNEVEILMFKQAIALGWDCPRASILVIFRELRSFEFTIQTIGRIMRMPELKYYPEEPELNKAFVFTNLSGINITEDYARDYVTLYESRRRKELYQSVALYSVYLKRQRERTRLAGEFADIFFDVASRNRLKDRISVKPSEIVKPVIADGRIVNVDKTGEIIHAGTIDMQLNEKELQGVFDEFIRSNCAPFAPADSSDRMKTALYRFLDREFGVEKYSSQAQRIILGKENVRTIVDIINLAKEEYRAKVVNQLREKKEIQEVPRWEVPAIISYNSKYRQFESDNSIMSPLYLREPSEPETDFIRLLSKSAEVEWWFRNGENEIKYFAVIRTDGFTFYPDFVVKFKNGTIGIYDTKKGRTAETGDAGPRAEGLQRYIKEQGKKSKKLWGGIVINVGGTWRYNDQERYNYSLNDLSDWKLLDI